MLKAQEEKTAAFIRLEKNLYDFAKSESASAVNQEFNVKSSLKFLYTENFDHEQIWSQIELETNPFLQRLSRAIKKLKNADEFDLAIDRNDIDEQVETSDDESLLGDEHEGEDEEYGKNESSNIIEQTDKSKKIKSVKNVSFPVNPNKRKTIVMRNSSN